MPSRAKHHIISACQWLFIDWIKVFAFLIMVICVGYFYLEPLSFEKFLIARDKSSLLGYIKQYEINTELLEVIHYQLMELVKEFTIIGSLPATVASWSKQQS